MQLRILLAEDHKGIAFFYEALLTDLGHKVIGTAATAAEAEALAGTADADLALFDIQLQGGSSYEAAQIALRRGIPVVFTSGYDEPPDVPDSLAGVPYLTKPLHENDIKSALMRFSSTSSSAPTTSQGPT